MDVRAPHDSRGGSGVGLQRNLDRLPNGWLRFRAEHDKTGREQWVPLTPYARRAYDDAQLEKLEGGLWHPWRRKWATERKGMPVKDLAAAGGWSDTATLLRSYQQSDERTLTQVVLEAPKLTAREAGGTEVTPLLTLPRPAAGEDDRAQLGAVS